MMHLSAKRILALLIVMVGFGLCVASSSITPLAEAAGDFVSIAPIPGITENDTNIGAYINNLYRLAIAVSAFLAVIMFAIGGMQYMTSEAMGSKEEGKDRMRSAIIGLLIVLSSALLLQIINPDILDLKLFN